MIWISGNQLHRKIEITVPSSKSICNRVLIINALSGNSSLPQHISDCDDTRVMVDWLTSRPDVVDIGAAGTAMRFSTALLSLTEGTHVITGSERMRQRPISVLVDALRELGAEIDYLENDCFPPLRICGNPSMRGGDVTLRGDVSSQYISALLMVAPYMLEGLTLNLTGRLISRPYIDMTLSLMRDFGASAGWTDDHTLRVEHGAYRQRSFMVEGDWSGCSYWYEILALSDDVEEVLLPGLFANSLQGDSAVAEIFAHLGISTEFIEHEGVSCARLRKAQIPVGRFEYDFVNQPDLAQTVVVTCCMMGVPFHFTGLSTLKIKETDRINALKVEMGKLGYTLKDAHDSELSWDGDHKQLSVEELNQVAIDTYDDHRMAMAFAPCCLKMGTIRVNHPEVVSKSYPAFWNDLESAGFTIGR